MITVNDNSSYYNPRIEPTKKTGTTADGDNTTANTNETLNIPKKIAQNANRITPELVKKAIVDNFSCSEDAPFFGVFGKQTTLYARDISDSTSTIELANGWGKDSKQRCQAVINDLKNYRFTFSQNDTIKMNVGQLTENTEETLFITGKINDNGRVFLVTPKGNINTKTSSYTN